MPEDNVVMAHKITVYIFATMKTSGITYLLLVTQRRKYMQWMRHGKNFYIKISGYFQKNSRDTTTGLRDEMRHHTAVSSNGVLSVDKDNMVSAVVI